LSPSAASIALQNIAKYAEASRATISLETREGSLMFTISDDGRGFDPAFAARGSGLQGMADRIEAIGGTLEIDSTPSQGRP
jgi:signal transduction histidine kinase